MGMQSVHTTSLSDTLQQCTHSHPHTCKLVGQVATCCHEVAAWQTQTWHRRRQTLHNSHLQQPRRVVNTLAAAGTQPAQLASALHQQANPDRAQHQQSKGAHMLSPCPAMHHLQQLCGLVPQPGSLSRASHRPCSLVGCTWQPCNCLHAYTCCWPAAAAGPKHLERYMPWLLLTVLPHVHTHS